MARRVRCGVLAGVRSATTSVKTGRTTVDVDPATCTAQQVAAAIADAGYTAELTP